MSSGSEQEVLLNHFPSMTSIILNRPEAINSLTEGMLDRINNALNKANKFAGSSFQSFSKVASVGVKVAAKGYVVQTTSYLYKLSWNDSIAAVFYQNYWMDDKSIDPKKKEAFDTTHLITLDLIGTEKAWSDVQSSIFSKRSEAELVRIATVNAIDAVIAKLQKKYDVFKTKTPLYTADPLTAKIGLKESLEKGDKFEVLEQELDEKTGKTKYVRQGVIKVDGAQIWDNRYMAAELAADTTKNASTLPKIDRTLFKGGNKYEPGMLIRQIQ